MCLCSGFVGRLTLWVWGCVRPSGSGPQVLRISGTPVYDFGVAIMLCDQQHIHETASMHRAACHGLWARLLMLQILVCS